MVATPLLACTTPAGEETLKVGIRKADPFTRMTDRGVPTGFAVRLWDEIACENAIPYETVNFNDIEEQEQAIARGDLDLIISPLTITAARLERYDFTQRYLSSGLTLALPASNAIDFEAATRVLWDTATQPGAVSAIVAFLSLNLLAAYIMRLVLKRGRSDPIGEGHGPITAWIAYILETLTRTTGLKGVGDGFNTVMGRVLEIFMAIVGTALTATVVGVLTSAFVGSTQMADEVRADDLPGMRVATLKCSTAQAFLSEQYAALVANAQLEDALKADAQGRIDWMACAGDTSDVGPPEMYVTEGLPGAVFTTSTWEDAIGLLALGEVDVVLGDWVQMSYLVRRDSRLRDSIEIYAEVFRNEPYGWAISRFEAADGTRRVSDEMRRKIDQSLVRRMRDHDWRGELQKVLGTGAISPN